MTKLVKNNKYNLDDVYKVLKIDEKKLFELYNKRNNKDRKELEKIVDFYNKQIIKDFDEKKNPRYFTWFHFIPGKARKAVTINRKSFN